MKLHFFNKSFSFIVFIAVRQKWDQSVVKTPFVLPKPNLLTYYIKHLDYLLRVCIWRHSPMILIRTLVKQLICLFCQNFQETNHLQMIFKTFQTAYLPFMCNHSVVAPIYRIYRHLRFNVHIYSDFKIVNSICNRWVIILVRLIRWRVVKSDTKIYWTEQCFLYCLQVSQFLPIRRSVQFSASMQHESFACILPRLSTNSAIQVNLLISMVHCLASHPLNLPRFQNYSTPKEKRFLKNN